MLKRIICLIAAISLLFVAGCGKDTETVKKQKNKPKVTEQPAETPEPSKDGWSSELVTFDLSGGENGADSAKGKYTINDNDYDIDIALTNSDEDDYFDQITVSVNGTESVLDSLGCYELFYASAAEFDGEDLIMFVATTGENDWSSLNALKYDGESLQPIRFAEGEVSDTFLPLSHSWNPEITLKDDNSFEIWRRTSSLGMWQTKRTCTLEDGVITEAKEEKYETNTKEFLTPKIEYDPSESYFESEEEYNRLFDGYVLCRKDYDFLKAGEYFTLLYDDGNNNIYVKTESGEEGWIAIPEDYSGYEIAPMLLYLAG
ncbi:MAG: SH3 domain-containing protein [Clostridia bacterium]|nr:SH3 domain-containing protein [Clostridia bacterium]